MRQPQDGMSARDPRGTKTRFLSAVSANHRQFACALHETRWICRRKLQWLKDASLSDAVRDQGPVRSGTVEIASSLTTVRAKGPQISESELKAAISNSARSAVALQLRHAAHTKRSTFSSQHNKEPDQERCTPSTPVLQLSETESVASVCGAISFDGCIAAVPQFAPNLDKAGPLSVVAVDVANSAAGVGQKQPPSAASSQLRVNAARAKRELRVLEHAAGTLLAPSIVSSALTWPELSMSSANGTA